MLRVVDKCPLKVIKCIKLQPSELHMWNFNAVGSRLCLSCLRESHGLGGLMRMESHLGRALIGARV